MRDADGHLRLTLNGEPVFHFGPLDQGWWPDGLYTAPTDEALAFDIEATLAMGFNTIRKHVKVEPARWYWHADRLGRAGLAGHAVDPVRHGRLRRRSRRGNRPARHEMGRHQPRP